MVALSGSRHMNDLRGWSVLSVVRTAGERGESDSLDVVFADDAVPPEQLYASQLGQLAEMGFIDTQENIRALSAVGGNVQAAVERLLGNLG